MMIDGREPPRDRIDRAVQHLKPHQRRSGAYRTLRALSLYSNLDDGTLTFTFPAWERLIAPGHPERVLPKLDLIEHTLTVTSGSLATHKQPSGQWEQTMWDDTPTITLDPAYRSDMKHMKLAASDFFQNGAYDALRAEVDELSRWRTEMERRKGS